MITARIAWRNVWRQKRRSGITIAAMAFGVAVSMWIMTWTVGLYDQMFEVMVTERLGHVQVHHPDYPRSRALFDTVPEASETLSTVRALPQVKAAAGRLRAYGLLGVGEEAAGGELVGVEPDSEVALSRMDSKLVAGRWLADQPAHEVVLGSDLAEDLGAGLGAEVVVVTQGADGSLANDLFKVVGVVRTGNSVTDRTGAMVHLGDAQQLLVLPDQVHEITAIGEDADTVTAAVKQALRGRELLVRSWREVDPTSVQVLATEDATFWFLAIIIFSAAGLGVLNTMLMAVFERTRELGVLLAVGLRPGQVVAMVMWESLLLSAVAAGLGLLLGGLASWHLVAVGIDLSAVAQGMTWSGVTFDPVQRGAWSVLGVAGPVVSVFLVGLLSSLWPALRAARLEPVQSMREG